MLRTVINITIIQQTQIKDRPARNKTMFFDFVHEFTCTDSWRDFTNDGLIILPKNMYVRDANNKLVQLFGTNVNIGGYSTDSLGNPINPLLMRGDKVIIDYGYRYFFKGREIFEGTYDTAKDEHLFEGWISEVTSKKPIQFKIEDNLWKLKQLPAPTKTYSAKTTLEEILVDLLRNTDFTVNTTTKTTFGEFRVGNETVAEVLGRLRKTYHFESYFRRNELRCGIMVYIEAEAKRHTFTFQQNIIEDQLDYKRKEDLVLSIVASNCIEESTGKFTKEGEEKTKKTRLEVLVTLRNGSDEPTYFIKKKGEDYPPNTGGERMTMPYPFAKTMDELKSAALTELRKYYYSGFKGRFTTFGIPFVKTGDNVQIVDPVLPERNGLYKVKSVEYKGGIEGIRQVVQLDYKIPT